MKLLTDILARPTECTLHCRRFSASLVFALSYGKRLDDDGKDLAAVTTVLENFIRDTYPGAHLVDTFPILDYLPDVFAPWRAEARRKHEFEVEVRYHHRHPRPPIKMLSPRSCSFTRA